MLKRHILKTFSYRILSSFLGFFVLYFTTGNLMVGFTWSGYELMFKPIIYFLHERFWYKYVKYGVPDK